MGYPDHWPSRVQIGSDEPCGKQLSPFCLIVPILDVGATVPGPSSSQPPDLQFKAH